MNTFLDNRLPARFWDKVTPEPNSGCWLWTGAINVDTGYGVFQRGRRGEGVASTHRHAYLALVGEVSEDLVLDHLCRVRCCVNPAHLEPVTQRENCLRGDAVFNGHKNRIKTHCPAGHPYDEANTYVHRGKRSCRVCTLNRTRARRAAA